MLLSTNNPKRQLIELKLGSDLRAWVMGLRAYRPPFSFAAIAEELTRITGVKVGRTAIDRWVKEWERS